MMNSDDSRHNIIIIIIMTRVAVCCAADDTAVMTDSAAYQRYLATTRTRVIRFRPTPADDHGAPRIGDTAGYRLSIIPISI